MKSSYVRISFIAYLLSENFYFFNYSMNYSSSGVSFIDEKNYSYRCLRYIYRALSYGD